MKKLLCAATADFITLDENMLARFEKFTDIMVDTNKSMNITAITDPEGIALKHYADSLSLISTGLFTDGKKVCDIGCGGGFPGIPMKIALPGVHFHMIDSTEKKINYLKNTAAALELKNIDFTAARAEELTKNGAKINLREKYDIATARAVARLNVLCELCLPFVKVGGYFLAMKGAKAQEEADEAKNAVTSLGGKIAEIKKIEFNLPDYEDNPAVREFVTAERYIIMIEKTKKTPPQYPRAYAAITKKPL
ncbi:MAG: 16S rRNA (guanine(527)-N(7))-methyltransferase RsmG [Ruminococcaceae bacterium]|nr:16S rRNA (guanine(527)-N(7))-methyltransferase RsmG [Oscillospiraceae bacterium]